MASLSNRETYRTSQMSSIAFGNPDEETKRLHNAFHYKLSYSKERMRVAPFNLIFESDSLGSLLRRRDTSVILRSPGLQVADNAREFLYNGISNCSAYLDGRRCARI